LPTAWSSAAVNDLGMRLGADKAAVMSFEDGFCFLGEDFGPRYPPATDDHRVVDPPRRVLYVALQGARVRTEAGRVVVESPNDQELLDVPSSQVERLVCFGAVGLTAGARSWALATGVDLVFLSRRGSYLGHGWPAASRTRVTRLRAQLRVVEDRPRVLAFARAVVDAKIRKQVVLLQRLTRRDTADAAAAALTQMRLLLAMLPDAEAPAELMGVEGASARAYFGVLGELMPDSLGFAGRNRRPPLDVVNAGLSYGYALLLAEAVAALCAVGLDPAVGLLHADDDDRPSLALDLIEEFRPLVVDQVVVTAARGGLLRPEHGRREDGVPGVLLTRAGREAVSAGTSGGCCR
jgi:CRISP-associated protein Cas1